MRAKPIAVVIALLACSNLPAQDSPTDAKQLVAMAKDLAKAKEFAKAAELMKKAAALEPRSDEYLALASDYELRARRFADGLADALAAIKINDKRSDYYIVAALNAFWGQNLDQARDLVGEVLKKGKAAGGVYRDALVMQDLLSKKQFTFYWKLDPKKGRMVNGACQLALPKNGLPYQSVKYEIEGAKSHRLLKGEVNDILTVVPQSMEPFALTINVTTEPYSYKKELAKATGKQPPPSGAQAYLGANYAVDPRSTTLKKVVAELKSADNLGTVRNILDWMQSSVEYKLQYQNAIDEHDFKNVDEIVKRGHAECRGYALLFVGLCRAAGVPARPIWGLYRLPPGSGAKLDIASHNWAEVYISGSGWLPVDPQRPETLGFLTNNYVRYMMDARAAANTAENLPALNLVFMNGGKLRFDEKRLP